MFSELAFVSMTAFLGVFVIDKYSTAVLIFICGILTYVVCTSWLKTLIEYYSEDGASEHNILYKTSRFVYDVYEHLITSIGRTNVYRKIRTVCYYVRLTFQTDHKTNQFSKQKHCGLALSLETEVKTVIDKILHTYVRSWFCNLSQNTDFILEINYVLEDVLVGIGNGISRMDKKEFLYHLIQVYLRFFQQFVNALQQAKTGEKCGTLEKCIKMKKEISGSFTMSHWALESSDTEWHYLQSFIGCLAETYGPVELMGSKLLQNVAVEALTQNLVCPIVDLLSNPDQLNLWILKALKSVAKEQNLPLYKFIADHTQRHIDPEGKSAAPSIVISSQLSVPDGELSVLDGELSIPDGDGNSNDCSESSSDQHRLSTGNLCKVSTPNISLPENDNLSVDSSSLNGSRSSCATTSSFRFQNFLEVPSRAHSNVNLSVDELRRPGVSELLPDSSMKRTRSVDFIRQMSQPSKGLLPINARNHSIRLSGRNDKMFVKFRANCRPTSDVEKAVEATESEVPRLFYDVKVIDTEQKIEPGHSPYTLYCIQYWGIFHDISSATSAPDLVKHRVNVKRRFREFLALQSRLEDIPELKLCLKGIKGPSKWLQTPFANLDKKNISERRKFLENYLLELCKQSAIVKSEVLQEFLAYGGDPSIAFVKKVSDINVPRIDKMIYRGVRGALGLFKTALPYTPTPSETGSSKDGDSEVFESDEDAGSELKFQESIMAFTKNDPEIIEDVNKFLRSFNLDSSTENSYLVDISPLDCMVVGDYFPPNLRKSSIAQLGIENSVKSKHADDKQKVDEGNHMTDAMIYLGVEVVQNVPKVFKSERFIFFVKHLFGPLLNVITEKIMAIVLEKENCAAMLHVLHKTIWPEPKPGGGIVDPAIEKGQILNEAIREYISEGYRIWAVLLRPLRPVFSETLEVLLGSIQNKEMNKCLLFHLMDVIVHSLCSKELRK